MANCVQKYLTISVSFYTAKTVNCPSGNDSIAPRVEYCLQYCHRLPAQRVATASLSQDRLGKGGMRTPRGDAPGRRRGAMLRGNASLPPSSPTDTEQRHCMSGPGGVSTPALCALAGPILRQGRDINATVFAEGSICTADRTHDTAQRAALRPSLVRQNCCSYGRVEGAAVSGHRCACPDASW